MRMKLSAVRTKIGLAAAGVALLATGLGFGAAEAAEGDGGTRTVSDSQVAETTPAQPTGAPVAEGEATAPAQEPAQDTPAATVSSVNPTEPAEAPTQAPTPATDPAPAPAPAAPSTGTSNDVSGSYTPAVPFTDAAGLTYVPAPVEEIPKMPSEPGYVPPVD